MRRLLPPLAGLILGAALGLLVHSPVPSGDLPSRSPDELGRLVSALSQEIEQLHEQIGALQVQLANGEALFHSDTALTSQEEGNLRSLELVTARAKGRGPGVVLEITDEQAALTPFEFQQIVSELRSSGAEAVVINGIRVCHDSYFGGPSPTVSLNGDTLRQPYIVQAVGAQAALATSLELPGGLLSNLQSLPAVKAPLYLEDHVVVPARAMDDLVFEYAVRDEG